MDRGAWQAAVYGVAKSWIRLSDFTSLQTQRKQKEGSRIKAEIKQQETYNIENQEIKKLVFEMIDKINTTLMRLLKKNRESIHKPYQE